ncbi:SigE-dependent sporulation protein [Lottiidibacillus patelloidae]|uniref:SigE-dependent sporulation protein n=1 Tax=Lottiidibacillus patelloidae TaxID=2670334 RepID=A0A263BY88_9BACI|nr:sporulation YhaL family protein [Lottiidibacillus patelloidae]OZM58731.1 SigE-dependent sporulation protein [Lottiidibacillus patelloidae]
MLIGMPWWGYMLLFGILFSGYMVLRTSIEERRMDEQWIEQQGEVYMKRMEQEKEERNYNRTKRI